MPADFDPAHRVVHHRGKTITFLLPATKLNHYGALSGVIRISHNRPHEQHQITMGGEASNPGRLIASPITFLVSLFSANVRIYETHNRGRRYDFGFLIGASSTFGGGCQETSRNFPHA